MKSEVVAEGQELPCRQKDILHVESASDEVLAAGRTVEVSKKVKIWYVESTSRYDS